MPTYKVFFYFLFLLIIQNALHCQERNDKTLDSLVTLEFKKLSDKFYKTIETNISNAELYAKAYLIKGKNDNNLDQIAKGFYLTSHTYPNNLEKRIQYIDSAINIRETTKHKKSLVFLYAHKGYVYNINSVFDKSLDHYIEALEYAKKINNTSYITIAQNSIAILKRKLGKYDEAKLLFKKCLAYHRPRLTQHKNDSIRYLVTLSHLIATYLKNKEIDSAQVLNNQGIQMSGAVKMPEGKEIIRLFRLSEGILKYHQKEYPFAIKTISEALKPEDHPFFENSGLIDAYLFLGKSYDALSKKELGLIYFKKIDSIVQHDNYVIPETRMAYLEIIKYYKALGDKNNQLYYINRLLYNDSLFSSQYRSLSTKINEEFDTPILLDQKEKLIADLETKKNQSYYGLILLSIIIILITGVLFISYQKNKRYKKRFEELMSLPNKELSYKKNKSEFIKQDASIGIHQDVVQMILKELEKFEKNKGFLKVNITSGMLAKKMNTNSKYLTKVIKYYRHKSFTSYINDLRIEYITEQLKTDTKLQKYTVKALALEAGFNSTEIFSKSFFKKNGIHPSYFIKRIQLQ